MHTDAPKPTSYVYGEAYQRDQVEKHRQRHANHWKPRIQLAHDLIDRHVLPRLGTCPGTIRTLDVGCSIGTMAIEMALRGFAACGVDFDASALSIARELAAEEHVEVEWFQGDVSDWRPDTERSIDIAICFDIFEHLHDDEVGSLLHAIRRQLSPRGSLVFYTFPLQHDYLFYSRDALHWPLLPFRWLAPARFERIARAYASVLDAGLLMATGKTYKERIKKVSHCNPTTRARLIDVLERAGYAIDVIDTANIYPFEPHVLRRFRAQPIAHRNLYGVAHPVRRPDA